MVKWPYHTGTWIALVCHGRSLHPWHTNFVQVSVWYSPCVILWTQHNILAHHMSSHGSAVEYPAIVQKVISSIPILSSDFFWILCLCMYFNIIYYEYYLAKFKFSSLLSLPSLKHSDDRCMRHVHDHYRIDIHLMFVLFLKGWNSRWHSNSCFNRLCSAG